MSVFQIFAQFSINNHQNHFLMKYRKLCKYTCIRLRDFTATQIATEKKKF